jgi:hypothetical protein
MELFRSKAAIVVNMADPSSSWEQPLSGAWEGEEEQIDTGGAWGGEYEDEIDTPASANDANDSFLAILMGLFVESRISAEAYCTLCHFAHLGGMSAEVGRHGMSPGHSSGHYSRHVKRLHSWDPYSTVNYTLQVPGHRKHDMDRSTGDLQVVPIHEAVEAQLEDDPLYLTDLQAAIDRGELPPSYHEHPLVRASPEPPVPLGLYIDGLPYAINDSVVGMWILDLVRGTRQLFCLVRKAMTCRCGCRGWCTFFSDPTVDS